MEVSVQIFCPLFYYIAHLPAPSCLILCGDFPEPGVKIQDFDTFHDQALASLSPDILQFTLLSTEFPTIPHLQVLG